MTKKEKLVLDLMGWQINGNDITKTIEGRPYLMVNKKERLKKTVARHLLVCMTALETTEDDNVYERAYYLREELVRIWNGLDLF